MNVFLLDLDTLTSASYLVDDHCAFVTMPSGKVIRGCKMAIEAVQILCTVWHKQGLSAPYKPTHQNHPWVLYAGTGEDAYRLVRDHALAILLEHEHRTGKYLPTVQAALEQVLEPPPGIPETSRYLIPVCMNGSVVQVSTLQRAVELYREYYTSAKISRMPRFTKRDTPFWARSAV